MKRILAAMALACVAVAPAACGPKDGEKAAAETPPPVEAAESAASTAPATTPAPSAGPAAAPDAPAFAVLYPGATLETAPVTATGPTGPGGIATYTTDADPDAVIAFHRARAEAAGLSSSMAMNQGDARAYGATSVDGRANLQVVASATEDGPTSVQLSWSAGK